MLLCMSADNVIIGGVLVHHIEENALDTRALLVDGIVQWIH